MDFSKLPGKIFLDNKFIKSKDAKIHVLNHSLHFATSVFEGIGVYAGNPLFLREHYKRLLMSAKIMGLKIDMNISGLEKNSIKLLKLNKIFNGYIRPIVFRSSNSMSPDTKLCKSILTIATWEWKKLFNKKKGINLTMSKYPRLNEKVYPIHAKSSGSYQTSVISRIEADKKKYDDCLMLDVNGYVAESSACNVFWIKNDIIFSPKAHSILNGITRKSVIEICKIYKLKFKIGDYKLNHLLNADFIFLTGTAAEIQTVKRINSKNFSTNSEIINFIKEKYELIKSLCPSEIKDIHQINLMQK